MLRFLAPAALAAVLLLAACDETEEQTQATPTSPPSPSATATREPTASGGEPQPGLTATVPAPSPTEVGGQAPDGCLATERVYIDPGGRFAFCYPEDMEVTTAATPEGPAVTVQKVPVQDPYTLTGSANFGVVEEPYKPCNDSIIVVKNERIEQLTVDGRVVEACFQDHYDTSDPPIFLFTTVELAVPTKGAPLQILAAYGPPDRRQNGVPVRDLAFRILNSAVIN